MRNRVIHHWTKGGAQAMPLPNWFSRLRNRPSTQRNIVKPRNWQDFKYPFIYGQFDPALFPIADWRECSRQALSLPAVVGEDFRSLDATSFLPPTPYTACEI